MTVSLVKNNLLMPPIWLILLFAHTLGCKPKPEDEMPVPTPVLPVKVWTTSGNTVNLLYAKTIDFAEGKDDRFPTIAIDSSRRFQTVEGFGYTLTGGSAQLLAKMGAQERAALLKDFFGTPDQGSAVSYIRISLGASDLDPVVFSYNDLPSGQTDPDLLQFSLSRDTLYLIPVLKEILAMRPDLTLMASPWSPPKWMKTNNSSVGGNLKPEYYGVYARYFVKYIQAMAANGIRIDAITPQNEPQHGGNNPSMVMSFLQQAEFIKNHLGPAFQQAGLATKIIIWDHNCDNPAYPLAILDDAAAKSFVHGTAFHLYAGDVSAMTQVHEAHPDKGLYFTEQWTGATSQFNTDLKWHMKNVIIGTMRNWSRVALEWNLANDPNFEPHTSGGCSQCKGAVTIDGNKATKNVSYYIIAQASKFVPPGSVRLYSNLLTELPNVAFITPDRKLVLIVLNESAQLKTFNIQAGEKWITGSLYGETVGTFVW